MALSAGSSRDLRGAERVVFFTDAVVAIAMTMLVLPLMEAVNETRGDHATTLDFVREHTWQLNTFLLSFVIIASFWSIHHGQWEHVRVIDRPLFWLNTVWQLCIVWLPVATAMLGSSLKPDATQYLLYIGPQLISMLALTIIARHLGRHPELLDDPHALDGRHGVLSAGVVVGLYAAALTLALVFRGLGYLSMFVLLLIWPVSFIIKRRGNRP